MTMLHPAADTGSAPAAAIPTPPRWDALDAVKAFALLWVFAVHWTERLFGGWEIANPDNGWPPLADRIAQLIPPADAGVSGLATWLLVNLGRAGDQGVQLFLIVSGFGLTWMLLSAAAGAQPPRWSDFYRRRLLRIYPEYWAAHLLVLAASFFFGYLPHLDTSFLLSLLGIRITPQLLYVISPAWWYVGLILQLYLVFPWLFRLLQRLGWLRFLALTLALSLAVRTIGLWVFADVVPEWGYVDAWSRGAVFITRLPEFVVGMALAALARQSPEALLRRLQAPATLVLAAFGYALGLALSAFLLGNGVAIALLGVSAFVLLFALFQRALVRSEAAMRAVRWLSRHTYSIFLMHMPIIFALIPKGAALSPRIGLLTLAVIVATVIAALLVEILADGGRRMVGGLSRPALWRTAAAAAAVWAVLVGAELWVRAKAPQEVNGWGERPSLQPDPRFGWTLIPNSDTRLRWRGYDYRMSANALGFPGPLYPAERRPGSLRVMATGDAFTSGEGVGSAQAWSRLLEQDLARRLRQTVEVQNFAVTGYGPNQYVAVSQAFLPTFKPDVLLVTLFVNDFRDVAVSDQDFRRAIGFPRTPADSAYAVLALGHLSTLARNRLHGLIAERLTGKPDPAKASLAQLSALRVGGDADDPHNRALMRDRLAALRDLAQANGARLLLLLVPSNVQVCGPDTLAVYPRQVDLADGSRFDLGRPQQVVTEIAGTLGIEAVDLRPALRASDTCPYHPANMHWTAVGHRLVATHVAGLLAEETEPEGGIATAAGEPSEP